MAVIPVNFVVHALTTPAAAMARTAPASAVFKAPALMVQLLGPIDDALKSSGLVVLPALVALFFLLRLWFGYGRKLFKPAPARAG